jgi:hypothetical protein
LCEIPVSNTPTYLVIQNPVSEIFVLTSAVNYMTSLRPMKMQREERFLISNHTAKRWKIDFN